MSESSATSLRLALIIHALQGGGAERLMSQLASRWARSGHAVHLITLASATTDAYPLDERVQRHGLDLMRDSQSRLEGALANIARVRHLRTQLRDLRPEFTLSFCDRMNIVTATAAAGSNTPVWLSEHSDPRKQRLGKLWETWRSLAYRRASGCVVLTDPIAAWMHNRFPKLQVEVIPPAIAPPRVPTFSDPAQVRDDGAPRLLALGRHSAEKNWIGLLHAWKTLATEFPHWTLVMAGDGPQHAELLRTTDALELQDRVEFTGWLADPWSVLGNCAALVLPSFYEGFPITLLEAMSMGLACVSAPASDSVQELASGGAVELARSPAPADLADALRNVLGSAERRAELSSAGRSLAAGYEWDAVGPRWDRLLARATTRQALNQHA